MGKILLLTLNWQEEKVIDKTLAAISDCILVEAVQTISYFSARNVFFPGLEIIQNKRQVFQDGEEVNLTPPLEYNTLVFLASNPGIVSFVYQLLIPLSLVNIYVQTSYEIYSLEPTHKIFQMQ